MGQYVDVLIPLPIKQLFTYEVNEEQSTFIQLGMRVSVPFGKRKLYTGIVVRKHDSLPEVYSPKPIDSIIDDHSKVLITQLKLWQWISSYYMCSYGEVLKAALPSSLLLEGESIITRTDTEVDSQNFNDDEFLILEAFKLQSSLKVSEIEKLLNKNNVMNILSSLLEQQLIRIDEYLVEKFVPKVQKKVRLNDQFDSEKLSEYLNKLNNAPKQKELLLHYFTLKPKVKSVLVKDLLDVSKASNASLNALVSKEIFYVYEENVDRVKFKADDTLKPKELSALQENCFQEIKKSFLAKSTCLLHGVTSSGKTEIYIKLIQEQIKLNNQVLLMVPELSLSTQLIERLKLFFGDYLVVYNSRYSNNERVEAYNKVLNNSNQPQLIIGLRSSVFLPYSNLGLIIIDEEHDASYKQFDPAPRFHARDTAVVIGTLHKANVLLGSATPSIESYSNALQGKYTLVELKKRYNNVQLPEIELVDLQVKYKKKLMQGHFSDRLIDEIKETLSQSKQVILFQNKRGYATFQSCNSCGTIPQCTQCDVSLTYHKHSKQLRCHYCGYQIAEPSSCRACGSHEISTKGLGTEQVELEFKSIFPEVKVVRMDQDTTRGKFGHEKIINLFDANQVQVLIGTQMVSKGLDFKNVGLVGVINADGLLFSPDYKAQEKTYQLISQVAGRAGRAEIRGKVLVQTFNPLHQIYQQLSIYDYLNMFKDQMNDRKQYKYPPFNKLIKLTVKHKDFNKVNESSEWLVKSLRNSFKDKVLGPEYPAVSRIRNQFNKNILIKIDKDINLKSSKNVIKNIINTFNAIKQYSGVKVNINVDF